MCGIAGWVDFDRDLRPSRAVAQAMTDAMLCRGPDSGGLWLRRHVALGHRRLSVIDLDGGHQPMTVEEGDQTLAVITYCGEVYNFRELRAQLIRHGHRFRTKSDTEVLLRAYLQWGAAFAERLNGMYALAIWDQRSEELILVRDRMGVKPLYYFPTPCGLLFGSEPKAILANPLVPRKLDADGLREVLDMVKTPEAAIFRGMYEVRPGQLVRLTRTHLTKRNYWTLRSWEHTDDLQTTIATVRELLTDAVARQLVADVPLCTLLSGGLDSSVVTALAAKQLEQVGRGPVRSFSVDFTDAAKQFTPDAVRGCSDAPFVRELADHVGAKHTEILLETADLINPRVRSAVLSATDAPPAFWGDMWPSLYLLFDAIRTRSTVALSGEAADELFGGYRWFRNPGAIKAETFPWLTSGSARYFGGSSLLSSDLIAKLDIVGHRLTRYYEALAEVERVAGESDIDHRMREITYLNLTRFVQTLLDRQDRMSMAVGLEVRVPFCDHHLIEYVFNTPWSMKSFDGKEKSLLRAAATDLLPSSILQRRKNPYPAIQDRQYERSLRQQLGQILASSHAPVLELLDVERARRAMDRPVGQISQPYDRGGLELALWLNDWLATYNVSLEL